MVIRGRKRGEPETRPIGQVPIKKATSVKQQSSIYASKFTDILLPIGFLDPNVLIGKAGVSGSESHLYPCRLLRLPTELTVIHGPSFVGHDR